MCGRIVLSSAPHVLAETFYLDVVPDLAPRWNIAPGQDVAVVVPNPGSPGNLVRMLRWGLVPPWDRGSGGSPQLINARCETVLEKPAFREAFRHRRCLVPADGFYEWQKRDGDSQPFLFRARHGRPLALAGLWEPREQPGERHFETCTIVTTAANALVRAVHHRMPVIIHPANYKAWFNAETLDGLYPLMNPYPHELKIYPCSQYVNDGRHEGPKCMEPLKE